LKEDGELTKGPSEVLDHWYQHFKKVLNVQSIYNAVVLDAMFVSPPLLHLDDPLTMMVELEGAMSRLTARKVGGLSGILPELVLYGGPILLDRLLVLMKAVWREGSVFRDWRNALPKKGDLQSCDNWCSGVELAC